MDNPQSATETVQQFRSGMLFTKDGIPVIEMCEYSCSPARIDGLDDEDDIAIRLMGEPEGLTPVNHTSVVPLDLFN